MMTYKNFTVQQAYDWDTEVAERNIQVMSKNGLLFYCYWLEQTLGYSGLGCDSLQIGESLFLN